MTRAIPKVFMQSLYLWLITLSVIVFNVAAAVSHDPRMVYMALVLTAAAAMAGIGLGLWACRTVVKARP